MPEQPDFITINLAKKLVSTNLEDFRRKIKNQNNFFECQKNVLLEMVNSLNEDLDFQLDEGIDPHATNLSNREQIRELLDEDEEVVNVLDLYTFIDEAFKEATGTGIFFFNPSVKMSLNYKLSDMGIRGGLF